MYCKILPIPKAPNLKLSIDLDSDFIYPFLFRQLIGSLIYLVNTRHDVFQ
jgi:hypothetical protein